VVTAVAEPDDVEPAELEVERDDEPVVGDPVATATDDVDVCAVVWLRASAGSWPETSWRKIAPVLAMKIAVVAPTTRRRIRRTRRRRISRGVDGMASASAPHIAFP
jgi:hypothetical protein